jgi:CBS domain-containing protein
MNAMESILDGKGHKLHVVTPDATVLEAVEAMCRVRVGALLVCEGDTLVGIFSERDLMTRVVLAQRKAEDTRVRDVMTPDPISIAPDIAPHHAMAIMTEHRVRHLPVVDGRRILGVVSIGDLVRWTIQDREHEIERLADYVSGRYPG